MIKFYKVNDEYGCFSNFSKHSFVINGIVYKTSEHYFQSKKFEGSIFEKETILVKTPMEAANLGHDRSKPLREDWENVKNKIMYDAVFAKFKSNKDIKNILISTGDEVIIEATKEDYYWGGRSFRNRKKYVRKNINEGQRYFKVRGKVI